MRRRWTSRNQAGAVLRDALEGDEPVVREHAAWAQAGPASGRGSLVDCMHEMRENPCEPDGADLGRTAALLGTGSIRERMRRLLALTLLILTSASSMEAVVGVMRDGEVHHENAALAASHAQESAGDHGHEDAATSTEHDHDEGHDHGTASDHCTHTHDAALLTSSPPPLDIMTVEVHVTESALPRAIVSDGFAHPPRA